MGGNRGARRFADAFGHVSVVESLATQIAKRFKQEAILEGTRRGFTQQRAH